MEEAQLREHLAALHEELEDAPEVHEETRRLLKAIMEDIRQMLGRSEVVTQSEHHSLVDRLRGAGRTLEESHPGLTTAVGQLIEAMTRPFQ